MTVTSKVLVQSQRVEDAATSKYTSTNCKSIVDAASFTNTTAGAVTVSVWLVPSGGAIGDATLIVKAHSLAAAETWIPPALIGRRLDDGDSIAWQASAAASITGRIDGRQVTGG